MKFTALPGFFDIIPNDSKEPWRNVKIWIHVERVMREVAQLFGYQEIRTPILEKADLFQKSTGESSDIVTKEMYSFTDKGERLVTLRPEGTPPVIRSLVERQLYMTNPVLKFFYIGPMFRYERQQAGRYRQHHQFGAEAIGNGSSEQDVELIDLLLTVYRKLGLTKLKVCINSIGDFTSRQAYRQALITYLEPLRSKLSADSQKRLNQNPLRILDSKDPADKEIVSKAPVILDFLNNDSLDHFEKVKELLSALKVTFEVNPGLVRGLDYYNKTVFEVVSGELGAQNSIGGGGRYDGLVKNLGGPDLPSIGFGTGIERIIQALINQKADLPTFLPLWFYIIPLGEKAKLYAFKLLHELRDNGVSAEMDFSEKKLQKMMQQADNSGALYTLVFGDQELEKETVNLKNMKSGKIHTISLSEIVPYFERISQEGAYYV